MDTIFGIPVLPLSKQIYVKIIEVDELLFTVEEGIKLSNMTVWKKKEKEYRLYVEKYQGKQYILSCFDEQNVTIWVQRQAWASQYRKLRPWFYIHLEEMLILNRALVLHSASIIFRGEAIVFTAPSGTGKTTQTDLWHRYVEGVTDLNGDRTLLQWTDTGWFACGFPIYGGTVRCEQAAVPIKSIIVIRQAATDEIRPLTNAEKVTWLYSEMTIPSYSDWYVRQALELIGQIVADVSVIQMNCTKEKTAVDTLYQYLYGEM